MRIIAWNVNSIRARHDRFLSLLERHQPDAVCVQETKVGDDLFPHDALGELGYHAAAHGQKGYNGVAVVSRSEPANVRTGLQDEEDDDQARLLAADVDGVRVISVYVPNGQSVGSDKFDYKLRWLDRLRAYLDRYEAPDRPLAICGDFNIARDDADVAKPDEWSSSVLCVPQVRDAFERLLGWGLVDVFREKHPDGGVYSWWDYQMLAFPKNNGLRIDHILATRPLAEQCEASSIDREERKGKRPSDHAPVIADFKR